MSSKYLPLTVASNASQELRKIRAALIIMNIAKQDVFCIREYFNLGAKKGMYADLTVQQLESMDFLSQDEATQLKDNPEKAGLIVSVRESILEEYMDSSKEQLPARALGQFLDIYFPQGKGEEFIALASSTLSEVHKTFTTQCDNTPGQEEPTLLDTLQQAIGLEETGAIEDRQGALPASRPGMRAAKIAALISILQDDQVRLFETAGFGMAEDSIQAAGPTIDRAAEAEKSEAPSVAEKPAEGLESMSTPTSQESKTGLAVIADMDAKVIDRIERAGLSRNMLSTIVNKFELTEPQVEDLGHMAEKGINPKGLIIALAKRPGDFDTVVAVINSVVTVSSEDFGFTAFEELIPSNRDFTTDEKIQIEQDGNVVDFSLINEFQETLNID
ncbi:MAG: hypothetical protein KDD62_10350, partial [Bdellovibrionales bacterium]|nr:hypothetical protein [Bdellovibrionales bacterium]